MTQAAKNAIRKETKFSISIGLAIIMAGGIWALAIRVQSWEHRLNLFEEKINDQWTYQMERELWNSFSAMNKDLKIPDVRQIRAEHTR